ncbi:MAG: L-alanine-DL-glutamate epimerase-like enolase superfamily enzyme [Saprospiraceae bacterium]|jgi:L-alanine-DL-glutamate epimerase-like enolase superfamily enzyme
MTNVHITKVEITPLQIELTEPFVISKGPLTHASITVVKIYTNEGLYGIGECCPYRTIHGETQAGSVAAARDLSLLLIGKDPTKIRRLVQIMDKSLAGNASIKGAIDMALYDLNAKIVNQPLYQYLNGDAEKKIYTDMTVSLLEEERMVEKALKFQSDGFPVLKVKLGDRPAAKDISRMQSIRKAVGDELPLRIDANQGWNYIEALRAVEGMKDLNIEHCEAPIHSGNLMHLARLREISPIAIMGDEAVFSHLDAFQTLSRGCIDLINIKLGKSGGICHAMKIAGIAEAFGVYCQVGSFSESRLGITALTHFSMAWDNIIYFDLDSPLMQSEDPIIGGMTYHKDWQVTVSDEPGIGADYDPDFLKRFETLSIE